mmetsp:Transcript_49178/g.97731  ORF Transcript_49178/g.97731 Transcript_49178/m.97731 type:complete len:421 (+) Transcript_49178:82-1344(+)
MSNNVGGTNMNEESQVLLEEDDEHESDVFQKMLPWGFESKLAGILGCIKFPFICLVAGIGLYAENHLKEMTKESWARTGNVDLLWGGQIGCYDHELWETVPQKKLIDFGLAEKLNQSLLHGHLQGDIWTSNSTTDIDPFKIGRADACGIDLKTCTVKGLHKPGFFTGGIDHLFSFSLIWFVYKLVFVGIHPVDRLVLLIKGNPAPGPDYPQPLLKLLTEPYFQSCTTPMQVLVKFLFYFRYKMMPNTLLGALASMHSMAPRCPRIVYYKMSPVFGNTVYFMCLLDIFGLAGCYAYVVYKMDGKIVGRWRYRLWKTCWLISAIFFAYFAIYAALMTFGGIGAIIKEMFYALVIVVRLDFTIQINLDLLRILTMIVIFFECLELLCLLIVIIGPKAAPSAYAKLRDILGESEAHETTVPGNK